MALQQVSIFIKGIVQGVGFRPFVFRLATEHHLTGTVLNDHRGVSIVFQGELENINHCLQILEQSPPPLARIDSIQTQSQLLSPALDNFSIIQSTKGQQQAIVALSGDKSTCQDCVNEMNDPDNRHFQYPFTNCTNCGPRYSIVQALPYDRGNTSMAAFDMCDDCARAYKDPLNRRYHAQPISCPHCGPHLSLQLISHSNISATAAELKPSPQSNTAAIINQTIDLLQQGKIIALKGLGGFHLMCDATNNDAVKLLRQRKNRAAKPLAVMVKNAEQAAYYVNASSAELQVLNSAEKPITVMQKRLMAEIDIPTQYALAPSVAPDIDRLGLFLPYTPLHHVLMNAFGKPLVATSANRSGEPMICDADTIINHLSHVVDAVLDHNRPILNACDDSVVQVIDQQLQVIRLARGYAPLTLPTGHAAIAQSLLAVGGQQKNALAFGFEQNMILSPHIGDLYSLEAQSYFERSLETFKRLYDFTPDYVIHDKHPNYTPSRWASEYGEHPHVSLITIQHHYAHVLAIMAANQQTQPVLGFSYDGTGLGDKGELWGSEVMLADTQSFTTVAHFSGFKLIGGEQAIKQPVRILLSLLFSSFSLETIKHLPINAIKQLSDSQLNNLYLLWKNPRHGIMCRSVGRLFDAVAVALNLIETNQFEGQAGMLIEAKAALAQSSSSTQVCQSAPPLLSLSMVSSAAGDIATESVTHSEFNEQVESPKKVTVWDSQALLKQLIEQRLQPCENTDKQTALLAWQFIEALAQGVEDIALQYATYPIVLCGGVFQNKLLFRQCLRNIKRNNLTRLPSHYVPVNDGGLALGQLWYGLHQLPLFQANSSTVAPPLSTDISTLNV
ncbi:carbamoyltransferase HypF [Shewanella intestini]|uniref:Carbamoyltransferase HypF n=1 Tax=Shewanella intestini TaxID=2017544 RepID=A0ABS5I3Z8_9GAMM|nr:MULTISPECIES: carbamoyltransferase HypF [Shewanella]MBR9728030.1 carbamoyltransferase HypF [Shewanella intestini]MRG36419.1 carbamoyltransferase HypF [Shewanella sp. XMDDZSB0408]